MKIIRFFSALLFLFLSFVFFASLTTFFGKLKSSDFDRYLGFLCGIGAYVILSFVRIAFLHQNSRWLRTFSHEITHVFFGLLFFHRIHNFFAGDANKGGVVESSGINNFIISLAPYFFPLFTFILLLFRLMVRDANALFIIDILIGFTYTFHFTTFFQQLHIKQPDLLRHGLFFSLSFILLMNIICIAMVLTVLKGGFPLYWKYFVVAGRFIASIIGM